MLFLFLLLLAGCKNGNKPDVQKAVLNEDSLFIFEYLKKDTSRGYFKIANLYSDTSSELFKRTTKIRRINPIWVKNYSDSLEVRVFAITDFFRPITNLYVIEYRDKKFILSREDILSIYDSFGKNSLARTNIHWLFNELMAREVILLFEQDHYQLRFGQKKISARYILNLKNIKFIKDSTSFSEFNKLVNDTTTVIPIELPDTSDVITYGEFVRDTISAKTLMIRVDNIKAEYDSLTKVNFERIKLAMKSRRTEAAGLIKEISKNYADTNYFYFYTLPNLSVYKIKKEANTDRYQMNVLSYSEDWNCYYYPCKY